MNAVGEPGYRGLNGMDELRQVAVLPWRIRKSGDARILLVTPRGRGGWSVPKGYPAEGCSSPVAASREAFEAAGIIGDVSPAPVTTYRRMQRLENGSQVVCRVAVFGINVRGTLIDWPEKEQRQRRWFSPRAAADTLDDAELAAFLRTLGAAPGRFMPSAGRSRWPEPQIATGR